jgi:hypothetical protein
MKSKVIVLSACLLGMGIAVLFLWQVVVVQITLPSHDGRCIYQDIASAGTKVCMRYIHSVERTPVQGWFVLDPQGGFRALRTMTTGTGTGLPNIVDADQVHWQGKWMVVSENNAYVPQIPFYYLPLNDLHIVVGDRTVNLNDVSSGSRLLITNQRMPLAKALWQIMP